MKAIDTFQITIIGAGLIGLAVAEELTARFRDLLVVEKNDSFGQETSSRNSEVIHAGIYYPPGLLKSSLCTTGNRLLYETCKRRGIPHKGIGKLIIATNQDECSELEKLRLQAVENGINNLMLLGKRQISVLEPEIRAEVALFSPSTGIMDTHNLMRSFLLTAEEQGATVAFRSRVTAVHFENPHYVIEINDGEYRFQSRLLINCAGLHSDKIAALVGMDIDMLDYRIKYCKGNYFTITPAPKLNHLVYPTPVKNNEALGIHATLDLNNRVRFGPDSEYVEELEYLVKESKKDTFYMAVRKYLPRTRLEDLQPDMSGIRPKLQGPGEHYRDFVIQEEQSNGFPGLINLIGIESPGLTSCLAIGKHVLSLAEKVLL